jgi:FkbM family methyltransferase
MKKMIVEILKKIGLYNVLLEQKRKRDRKIFDAAERKNAAARIAFYSKFLSPGDLVFDVGANVGNRVQSFLDIQCRVVAVEPQSACVAILKDKFKNRIQIEQVGLGGAPGEMEMFIADESTISTLSPDFIERTKDNKFKRNKWEKKEKISITTMDALVQKHGKPAFCKIDVEGYESEVLRGLSAPIDKLSFEFNVPEMSDNLVRCLELLNALSPEYRYNYSIGESMVYALDSWMNFSEFMQHVKAPGFAAKDFGDIYVFKKSA